MRKPGILVEAKYPHWLSRKIGVILKVSEKKDLIYWFCARETSFHFIQEINILKLRGTK